VSLLVLVVDDEPDVEALFRQHFRRDLRAGRFTMEFAYSASVRLEIKPRWWTYEYEMRLVGRRLDQPRTDKALQPAGAVVQLRPIVEREIDDDEA
jgi:hypothetical protein